LLRLPRQRKGAHAFPAANRRAAAGDESLTSSEIRLAASLFHWSLVIGAWSFRIPPVLTNDLSSWAKSSDSFDLLKIAGCRDDNGERPLGLAAPDRADSPSAFQGLRRLNLTLVLAASTLGTLAAFFLNAAF